VFHWLESHSLADVAATQKSPPEPPPVSLGFRAERQSQSNWCWVAVATSVANFFRPEDRWTQCKLANAVLPVSVDCCRAGECKECDQPWQLEAALQRTHHLDQYIPSAVDPHKVTAQIHGGAPVCIRIRWTDNGATHFLGVSGVHYGPDERVYFELTDPIYRESSVSVSDLFRSYQQRSCLWTDTYYTRR